MNHKARKLYILPFDHRGSFVKMFGFAEKNLRDQDSVALRDYKHIIYEGFLAALELGVSKSDGAILVDEQFGAKIHEEARAAGITRILTVEKSGEVEFDFEYGEKFGDHIDQLQPEYVKALVRYNPATNKTTNERQIARLKILNDFCGDRGYKFLFELLAVPTAEQTANGADNYEKMVRGEVMRQSIRELRSNGIEPDIWKLEGFEDTEQFQRVVDEALRPRSGQAQKEVGVVILGRGESEEKVRKWLMAAAKVPGVVGLAVGRTVFQWPLIDFAAGKISRNETALKIAQNYKGFIDLFSAEDGSASG